jgi:MFS family permease
VAVVVSEIFSLWAVTPFADNGVGFSPSEISYCFVAQGVTILCFQLFLFKPLTARMRISDMFTAAMLVHSAHALVVPFLSGLAQRNWAGFWVLLIVLFVLRGAAMAAAYTAGTLLLNNCTDQKAGAIFGMVESAAALWQSIGPLVGSIMLAWSENNGMDGTVPRVYVMLGCKLTSCCL